MSDKADSAEKVEKDPDANKPTILPDISIPPPPLPPGYKSLAYPAYIDKLTSKYPAAQQMKSISLNRKSGEQVMYISAKPSDYKNIRSANQHINKYCEICSEFIPGGDESIKPPIFLHNHNSSKQYRINAPTDTWGNYPCFTCSGTPHSCKVGVRYAVLVSSSTMNNWQGLRSFNGYQGDPIHIDYITIPGATVKDLHHAFLAEYGNIHRPVDVVLVAGFNNIIRGSSADEIMKDIIDFNGTVSNICFGNNNAFWSSFAAATLPFPPKLAAFDGENRKLRKNHIETLVNLTTKIRVMNQYDNHPTIPTHLAPCFHTWGVRIKKHTKITGPVNLMEHFANHRHSSWREKKPSDMLHLSDHLRLKMGKSVVEYFRVIYKYKDIAAKSKNEALAAETSGAKSRV